jgi:ketosteroid isomerase-like protein
MHVSDKQSVLDVNQAFYRAFEKKDLTAMDVVWSQGTDSLCIHPGRNALKGWDAVRSSWEKIFLNTRYLEIETNILKIEVMGDLAYVVLVETVLQVANGRQIRAESIATNIFERLGQKWYLVHHHGSPVMS